MVVPSGTPGLSFPRRYTFMGRRGCVVGEEGGYTAESDAATLLDGLGVEDSLHQRLMGGKCRAIAGQRGRESGPSTRSVSPRWLFQAST